MNIILIGPPGSGKGTQAQFIKKYLDVPHISIGDILRNILKKKGRYYKKIKLSILNGKLVNDNLVITFLKERIHQNDCKNGFLLEGFPRTLMQANFIKIEKIPINYVIHLNIPDFLVMDRVIGRRIHLSSGRIYHTKFNLPKFNNIDDITGETLTKRKDDVKSVVLERLKEYHKQNKSIIEYYCEESNKGNVQYFNIDGTLRIEEINNLLVNIFNVNK